MSNSELQRLLKLGQDLTGLTNLVANLEYELSLRKKELEKLSGETLPQAMTDMGLAEFRLTTGEKIRIKPVLVVQLPKANVDRAEAWLREHGHDGLMKHTIEIALPKTTDYITLTELYDRLETLGVDYEDKKTIHYQTLNKWSREMDEQGEVIPTDIFNVHRTVKTEVTN